MYISVSPYAPGNETLVRSDYSPEFEGTAIRDLTWNFAASSAVSMNATDRVVLRLYTARVSGPTTCAATVYFDGTVNLSYIQTTLPSPVDILTTRGDLLTRDASNMTRLPLGSSGTFVRSNGSDPSWQALIEADIPNHAYTKLTYTSLTTGQSLRATSSTSAAFGALDLSNSSAITGVLPVANGGTGKTAVPIFSVNKNGTDQTGVANNTFTLVTWSNEVIDSNADFSSSKFTPSVAGTYLCFLNVAFSATVDQTLIAAAIYKNGSVAVQSQTRTSSAGAQSTAVAIFVAMNGSTDFLEAYCFQNSGSSQTVNGNAIGTFFTGARIGP
jgi:hypothetical protein